MHARERSRWATALLIFVAAFAAYVATAAVFRRLHTPDAAYFNLLADAFLHRRLYLLNPPVNYDLTRHKGYWYVAFPPLPALIMLPWVAVFGVARTNTVLWSCAVAGLNVALAYGLLNALVRRGWVALRHVDTLWLTLLFGLGSVHWYMATMGSVWFFSQICTATGMLAAAWIAVRYARPALAGVALGLAMLARPTVALCLPLLLGVGLQLLHERGLGWRTRAFAWWTARVTVPLLASSGLLLAYNAARFGNPFDFGYLQQNVSPELQDALRAYGQFDLHFVPRNVWTMLLALPEWSQERRMLLPRLEGMSLVLVTPALVYAFAARPRSPLLVGAWLAVGLLLVPLLTYYNTGWWQFGYRFSLDFMTPLLVLVAAGAAGRGGWPLRALIVVGVLVNAWGVWWFLHVVAP